MEFGLERQIELLGSISGIPPMLVEITYKPQAAASKIAKQNASVIEVQRNICPWDNKFGTSSVEAKPLITTCDYKPYS